MFRMHKLGKEIYIQASHTGVTVGAIVTAEGIVLVDAPTQPADADAWLEQVRALSPLPIRYLVLTDHHRDRALTAGWFKAPVIIHELAFDKLRIWPEALKPVVSETGADTELVADTAGARLVLPSLTYANRLRLQLGATTVELEHHPGSTPGATWVRVVEQDVVFVGDSLVLKQPPFLADANLDGWLEQLDQLRKPRSPGKTIVSGRGGTTGKDGVKPFEDTLRVIKRKLEPYAQGRKGRHDLEQLVTELAETLHLRGEQRDHYLRRLRHGLEAQFDSQLLASAAR